MNYILSLKHSPIGNEAVWWRPNAAGYTTKLEDAGKYSDEQVSKNPMYFNNGTTSQAIPVFSVELVAHKSVSWDIVAGYRSKSLRANIPKVRLGGVV